jgi:hypothetical protein
LTPTLSFHTQKFFAAHDPVSSKLFYTGSKCRPNVVS